MPKRTKKTDSTISLPLVPPALPARWEQEKYDKAIGHIKDSLMNNYKFTTDNEELLDRLAKDLFEKFTTFKFTVNGKEYSYVLNEDCKTNDSLVKKFANAIARNAASSYRRNNPITDDKPIQLTEATIDGISQSMQDSGISAFVGADAQTFSSKFCAETHYDSSTTLPYIPK